MEYFTLLPRPRLHPPPLLNCAFNGMEWFVALARLHQNANGPQVMLHLNENRH